MSYLTPLDKFFNWYQHLPNTSLKPGKL